jgi:hypothetical protein
MQVLILTPNESLPHPKNYLTVLLNVPLGNILLREYFDFGI